MGRSGQSRRLPPVTIQWHDSAAMAARLMQAADVASIEVVADTAPIGRITRDDIERCRQQGNWLGAICVRDIVRADPVAEIARAS